MMAIAFFETYELQVRGSIDNPQIVVPFMVTGLTDETNVINLVESNLPATRNGLLFQDYTFKAVSDHQWRGEITYGIRQDKRTGESQYRFDTTGGTQKITQSKETISKHAGRSAGAQYIPPDFKQAINVNHDRVEGTEIGFRAFAFEETHYVDESVVTATYKRTIYDLSWTVNDAAFKGLARGECLFMGCTGSKRGADNWELTFKFAGAPNETNIELCDDTTDGGKLIVNAKEGWHYLWQRYEEHQDTKATKKHLVMRPRFAYVERVYEYGDFSALGIGT